jgi:hypothetical protein
MHVWMMLYLGEAGVASPANSLKWENDQSLETVLELHFRDRSADIKSVTKDKLRGDDFAKHFTLRDMTIMCGFEIFWTDNLFDHLNVEDGFPPKVHIFHHATVLKELRDGYV